MLRPELTPEQQIEKHYLALLDSVGIINQLKTKAEPLTEDEADILNRNVGHCRIMLQKDFWTTEDLDVVREAIGVENA